MHPSPDQALQYCIMLQAGLPPEDAIRYFLVGGEDPTQVTQMLATWQRSAAVRKAMLSLMGKSWQDMSLDDRIRYALEQHYSSLAYLLFSNNYISVGAGDKAKMDTARTALEAKLAGTAGKGDALSRFFDDLNSGKLSLKPTPLAPALKREIH